MTPAVRTRPMALLGVLAAGLLPACAGAPGEVPECDQVLRMAVVAQAVPGAAYLPCLDHLEEGWRDQGFVARRGQVRFRLHPDRAGGRPVTVLLEEACDVSGAVPTAARAEGVRTSVRLRSITPNYAGTLVDVFPGGCVTYQFDFPRGPHIALTEDLEAMVGLLSRQQLRLDLHEELDVELDP